MTKTEADRHVTENFKLSFEFFPPKNADMDVQLWETVEELSRWHPDFVSVTYGAGGTTKAPTLVAVDRMISIAGLPTASHLTCVDASKQEVHDVVEELRAIGVKRFVALRGDPSTGPGTAYKPHPDGYENAAALVRGCVSSVISKSRFRPILKSTRKAKAIPSISTCSSVRRTTVRRVP